MPTLLNLNTLPYFFGPHFDVDVAHSTAESLPDLEDLCADVSRSIDEGVAHTGLHLIGYENLDTGLSVVAAVKKPGSPSMVSFYAESKHRVFGGATITCVPLAFCSTHFQPNGDYVVYRHTFKRPRVSDDEYISIMNTGTDDERAQLFLSTRSRDGFETIPGMSYVGISRRPWQKRYAEHIESAISKGSAARLHEAMRTMQGQKVIHVHDISAVGLTEVEARRPLVVSCGMQQSELLVVVEPGGHVGRLHLSLSTCPPGCNQEHQIERWSGGAVHQRVGATAAVDG